METPDSPRYRVPDDIAWIDGTEIGLGEELYLTRVRSGDTVQLVGTARIIWHAATQGGTLIDTVASLTQGAPDDMAPQMHEFVERLRVARLIAIEG